MLAILSALLSSAIITKLILKFSKLHLRFSGDSDFSGVQKFHKNTVPRIGGISIFFGLVFSTALAANNVSPSATGVILLLCSIPAFAIGLTEDLTKLIGVKARIAFVAFSAALFVCLTQTEITRLGIPHLDIVFVFPGFGIVFTVFAITGLANAYNIIDGFNGLSGMVGILSSLAIALVAFFINDPMIMYLSIVMASSISGFFIWNYPRGKIFLGDGGAYLIGFWIASLSILFVARHQEISPWFGLVVNIYPVTETLFTIYRRKMHQGKSPGRPDGMHLHTLIYRRIIQRRYKSEKSNLSNSKTAPYFWLISTLGIIPAVLWPQSSIILIISSLIFIASYIWIYLKIVKFKCPSWLLAL